MRQGGIRGGTAAEGSAEGSAGGERKRMADVKVFSEYEIEGRETTKQKPLRTSRWQSPSLVITS